MFRKSKPKHSPPPQAPNIDEILEDLQTFQVEKPLPLRTRTVNSADLEAGWWKAFETFVQDVGDLKKTNTSLNGYRLSLESNKLEIDTLAANIENDIEEHLARTRKDVTGNGYGN